MPCTFDNIERALWPALRETQGNAMTKPKRNIIEVQGASIALAPEDQQDVICLIDIAKFKNTDHPGDGIRMWLRCRDTVEFLWVWERINNLGFNSLEFEGIRNEAGRDSFFLSAGEWIRRAEGNGLIARTGRYSGTRGFQK